MKTASTLAQSQVRDLVKKSITSWYDPERVLDETKNDLQIFHDGQPKQSQDALQRLDRREDGLRGITSLDDHNLLAETVGERYRTAVIEYAQRLEAEHGTCTVIEKSLIELAASAYGRHLSCAARLEETLQMGATNSGIAAHCAMLGKEIDRSSRQLSSALSSLRSLRMPALSLSVGSI